jgi:hypothetical protein
MNRKALMFLALSIALTPQRSHAVDAFAAVTETGGHLLAVTQSGIVWMGTLPQCEWIMCGTIPVTSGEFVAMESGDQDRQRTVAITSTGEIWSCDKCYTACPTSWEYCGQVQDPLGGSFVGLSTIDPLEQRLAAITDRGTIVVGSLCAPSEVCRLGGASPTSIGTWGLIKSRAGR